MPDILQTLPMLGQPGRKSSLSQKRFSFELFVIADSGL